MPEITLRNPERKIWMTGWGVINRGLAPVCDSEDNRDAPIHFFMSPPYSFTDVDPRKFNVGMTMGERDNLHSYNWDGRKFVPLCNQMDLLIVPGTWQKQVFMKNGVKPPVEIVMPGHSHKLWQQPVVEKTNKHCLILDRGRDHGGAMNEAQKYFSEVTYLDIRTPSRKSLDAMPPDQRTALMQNGKMDGMDLQAAYRDADVFFKWGREGFCYPILEAMSAGCLVITNCHTLPYIDVGKNALVFRDVNQLKNCMMHAERRPMTDVKLAGQATAKAMTWEKSIEEVRKVIFDHAERSPKAV